jgi:hypothetical protein
LEAPPGFEPGMEVLQTSALPLGDGADQKEKREPVEHRIVPDASGRINKGTAKGIDGRTPEEPTCAGEAPPGNLRAGLANRSLTRTLASVSEGWSGKRDSNPRLRPWQGRTLPLSYSRSPTAQRHTLGPRHSCDRSAHCTKRREREATAASRLTSHRRSLIEIVDHPD